MVPSPGSIIGVVVVVVAAVVCGRIPLLSNPGPESGMVLAVVGGLMVALLGAGRGARRERAGFVADWKTGLLWAALFFIIFALATAVGAAMSPSCSENAGLLPMIIVAVPVLLVQAALGPLLGRLAGRRGLAVAALILVELVAVGSVAFDLLNEPGFRTASHLFVVLSGDLLAGAALSMAAIGFRVTTLLLAASLALLGAAMWPAQKSRGLVSGAATDTIGLWVATALTTLVFFVAHSHARSALIPGRAALEEAYSLVKQRGPLVVHADPLTTTPREVDAVLAEGTMWLERLRARLGPLSDDEIHIWAHHDRDAMARHTGAVHVDFALPWRRELHIGSTAVPHRTLGHELAHVVLGERSTTLLRVPSRFIVMHNAAVTEGMAMAVTPELAVDQGLTLREQAAAMRRAGLSPTLERLFSLTRFYGEEPGRAYVAAGAFIEAIVAEAGDDAPHAIERLYADAGDLEAVSADVTELIGRHERSLDAQPLPTDAIAFAAARFKRQSILDQVCEPEVVAVGLTMRRLARTGDLPGAMEAARTLEGDDADGTLSALLTDVRAVGDVDGAITLLRRIVELAPSPSERAVRELALGIELWRAGREREALSIWHSIDDGVVVADLARQIAATRRFADTAVRLQEAAPVSRAALEFFIGDGRLREGARLTFARAVGSASGEPEAVMAVARYILGRALVQQGALDEAVRQLRPLVVARVLPETFHEQAVLGLVTALVRASSSTTPPGPEALEEARTLLLQAAEAATRPAMRLFLRDRAERVARAAAAPVAPTVSTSTTAPAWGDRLLLGSAPDGTF